MTESPEGIWVILANFSLWWLQSVFLHDWEAFGTILEGLGGHFGRIWEGFLSNLNWIWMVWGIYFARISTTCLFHCIQTIVLNKLQLFLLLQLATRNTRAHIHTNKHTHTHTHTHTRARARMHARTHTTTQAHFAWILTLKSFQQLCWRDFLDFLYSITL